MSRVAVAIATMNRRDELLAVLRRFEALPDDAEIVVVDNASTDGTAAAVRRDHPGVRLVSLDHNIGCAARNAAALTTGAEVLAFSDDDSWWAPGALTRAADLFATHPRLGLLAGRILVGPQQRLDPVCVDMARGTLGVESDLPGPSILGFLACGAVVRRSAFLAAGGFEEHFLVGGEENLLAWDLAAAGWGLAYVDTVVAHHHPSPARNVGARRQRVVRNDLWTAWLRRSFSRAVRSTASAAATALRDADARAGLRAAVAGASWALARRRPLPAAVQAKLDLLG